MFFLLQILLTLCLFKSIFGQKQLWNCSRSWPHLELFLPIHIENGFARNNEWENLLFRSLLLYWPFRLSKTTLRLIIDAEYKDSELKKTVIDDRLASISSQMNDIDFPKVIQTYFDPSEAGRESRLPRTNNDTLTFPKGNDRQEYLMLVADVYSNAEYIGFVDADAFFHSYVDREDIFEHDKPVVHGKFASYPGRDKWRPAWIESTYDFLGMEVPLGCMNYFPVVVKASHLRELREYVEELYNKPFIEAFLEQLANPGKLYCQFDIMCTFMWWFKHDEYTWYVHDASPWWDGSNPRVGQYGNKQIFSPSMFEVKPFVSKHMRFFGQHHGGTHEMAQLIGRSLCFSNQHFKRVVLPIQSNEVSALSLKHECVNRTEQNNFFHEMHGFEEVDYSNEDLTNRTLLLLAHKLRNERISSCEHTYYFI